MLHHSQHGIHTIGSAQKQSRVNRSHVLSFQVYKKSAVCSLMLLDHVFEGDKAQALAMLSNSLAISNTFFHARVCNSNLAILIHLTEVRGWLRSVGVM